MTRGDDLETVHARSDRQAKIRSGLLVRFQVQEPAQQISMFPGTSTYHG